MSRVILKRGNDQVVTLTGLRTTDPEPMYLNAASVIANLFDSKGVPVTDYQNIPMQYVNGSKGDYDWNIEGSNMMLPKSVEYTLEIKAEQGGLNYRVVHALSVVDA